MKMNVCEPLCPSHQLLNIIGSKWIILILYKLSKKTYCFGELQREVKGISKKVLTNSLRNLEKYNLIGRKISEVPLKVEYSLTELGISLSKICETITVWAEENVGRLE